MKIDYLLRKSTSWLLLITFFVFDNVFSYYAVKYLGGREANLLIASFVEKNPSLYFFFVPITILIVYLIYLFIKSLSLLVLKKRVSKESVERIVLSTIVIYWLIGNSSVNIVFLLGYRIKNLWNLTMIVAFIVSVFYSGFMVNKELKKSL